MAYKDVVLADSPGYYLSYDTTVSGGNEGSFGSLTHVGGTTTRVTPGVDGTGGSMANSGTQYRQYTIQPATIFNTSNWSVEMWFKKSNATTQSWQELLNIYKSSDANNNVVIYAVQETSLFPAIWYKANSGTQVKVTSNVAVDDTDWHHLVATKSGSTVTLYLDAQVVGTGSAGTHNFFGTFDMWLNAYGSANGGNENFSGNTDEVAFYASTLSQARIDARWEAGPYVTPGGYTAQPMTATAAMPAAVGVGNVQNFDISEDTSTYSGFPANNYGTGTTFIASTVNGTWNAFVKTPAVTLAENEIVTSATLNLTYSAAPGSTKTINIYKVTSAWDEGTLTFNTEPTKEFVRTATLTSGQSTLALNVLDAYGDHGIMLSMVDADTEVSWRSSDHATVADRPTITYITAPIASVSPAGEPLTASATMPEATVSTTSGTSAAAQALTATAEMVDPAVDVISIINIDAEPAEAQAAMGDSGFAQPITVPADVVTADALMTDAAVETTRGVAYNAAPMTASAQWVQPELVNDAPIVVDENEDKYFLRVDALGPTAWFRLNDTGSVADNRTDVVPVSGTYVGVQMGNFDAPESRHSVYFDGQAHIDIGGENEATGNEIVQATGSYQLEFSFRTAKENTFLMVTQDQIQETLSTNNNSAKEVVLKGGKLTLRSYEFGTTYIQTLTSEFSGFKNLADNEWHHVVIKDGRTSNGEVAVELWIDGAFERRRSAVNQGGAIVGFPDYVGGRPDVIEQGSALPTLPASEWFVGDMSEIVFYNDPALNKETIPRNYYAFMGWTPIETTALEAFAFAPDDARGRGNQKRALALWFSGGQDKYSIGGDAGNNKMNFNPLIGVEGRNGGTTDFEGYKVFLRGVTSAPGGGIYRDPVTDDPALINLETDVDLADYDLITFMDWPDEGSEIDFWRGQYPGNLERLINQLRDAVDAGVGLLVTHPRLAVDLGIIDRIETVPTLRERRAVSGQGNATGMFDYGSAVKFPWNISSSSGMVGASTTGAPSNGQAMITDPGYLAAKAFYYGDTNKNDRFRVRAQIEGLTDIPSYMIEDAVYHVDYDPWGWQGIAYKYLNAMDGLTIGDEFIYHGTDMGYTVNMGDTNDLSDARVGRWFGSMAVPLENVKAGTVVTTFGDKHWDGTAEVDNPYKNYATTIVVRPGDVLAGRQVGGKIFVNFTEQPNRFRQDVAVQLLPDVNNDVQWPSGYGIDTDAQREWGWSFTRRSLTSSGTGATQELRIIDAAGNTTVINAGGANFTGGLTMVRSHALFPTAWAPNRTMVQRGWEWLSVKPEVAEGDKTVRAVAITASAEMPNPTVVAEKDAEVRGATMSALAVMPKVAEDVSGDAEIVTLPMEATATITGYGKTISVEPMTAEAELVENFDMVHATGEQVVLTLHAQDVTLYMKEEV